MAERNESNVGMWIAITVGGVILFGVLALLVGGAVFMRASTVSAVAMVDAAMAEMAAERTRLSTTTEDVPGQADAIDLPTEAAFERLNQQLVESASAERVDELIGSVSYTRTVDTVTFLDPPALAGPDPAPATEPDIQTTEQRVYQITGVRSGRLIIRMTDAGVQEVSFIAIGP